MSTQDPMTYMDDVTQVHYSLPAAHEHRGVYIYCVVPAGQWQDGWQQMRAPAVGGRDDTIRLVRDPRGELAALVSEVPSLEIAISRDDLLAHEGVIEEAMARSDVVPLRFGTIATSDEEVRQGLLDAQRDLLRHLFERVNGRVELGLKVFWRRERLFAEIAAEDDAVRAHRHALGAAGNTGFFQRLQLGRMTEQAIMRKRDQEADRMLSVVEPLADESALGPLLSDLMILNAAFLVERSQVPIFEATVRQLEGDESGRLILRYVGPLPPYSFAAPAAFTGR